MNVINLYTLNFKTKIQKQKNYDFPFVFPFVKLNSKEGKEDDVFFQKKFYF